MVLSGEIGSRLSLFRSSAELGTHFLLPGRRRRGKGREGKGREQCERSRNCPRRLRERRSGRGKHAWRQKGAWLAPARTIDQRLMKFWRDRSNCAPLAVDSRIVFTPASTRLPLSRPFFPSDDEANDEPAMPEHPRYCAECCAGL